jgi:hypothetical protein
MKASSVMNSSVVSGVGGVASSFNSASHTEIIADGNNLIICYITPGIKGTTYFCLKNVHLRDFNLSISSGDIPNGKLDFNFFDSESKSFEIPEHIPKEQHTMYIKGQFNLEDNKSTK